MTIWGVGDIAVAKLTLTHCGNLNCEGGPAGIEKGKLYRVESVHTHLLENGTIGLCFGQLRHSAVPRSGKAIWRAEHFEKLLPASSDIFQMAAPSNAPKVKEDA